MPSTGSLEATPVRDPLSAFRLDGRVIVITGASSGLGVGFAHAVAAVGGQLVLAARREEQLKAVAEDLRATGATVITQVTDVSDAQACADLVDTAVAQLGRVDVLVNNAGIGGAVPASRETPEAFRQVLDVNLVGSFLMAQACARVMPPGSSIVNVSSVLGLVASQFPQASYASSKAGLIGLTRDLAQQWSGRKGIRVNALCPGYFLTEMTAGDTGVLGPVVSEHTMLGRFGEQHELDSALLFLASPASNYMTGTVLTVDGGLTA
jgi:NAD(P)-dependent dehydrogenase (short-subunit alcohol dehydrogenase family)